MVTVISIATISGIYFLADVVFTYQIWACYVMEWQDIEPSINGTQ